MGVQKSHKVQVRSSVKSPKSASYQMWISSLTFLKLC